MDDTKHCQQCGDLIRRSAKRYRINNDQWNKTKFCSQSCKTLSQVGISVNKGAKNGQWKGDKVGYASKHDWVEKRLGKPSICEYCGKTSLTSHQIHWANKSGKYKRVLSDWIRLCVSCHSKYDGKTGEGSQWWKGGQISIQCLKCRKTFKVDPYRKNTAKYCSLNCKNRLVR